MPPSVDMRRVWEVVRYSQPRYRRVKMTEAPGVGWVLKAHRPMDFGLRVDRAVRRAVELDLGYVDEALRELRPTEAGYALIAEKGW